LKIADLVFGGRKLSSQGKATGKRKKVPREKTVLIGVATTEGAL